MGGERPSALRTRCPPRPQATRCPASPLPAQTCPAASPWPAARSGTHLPGNFRPPAPVLLASSQPAAPSRPPAWWAVLGSPRAGGGDAHHMAARSQPPESGKGEGSDACGGGDGGGRAAREERRAKRGAGGDRSPVRGRGAAAETAAAGLLAALRGSRSPGTPTLSIATLLTFGADVTRSPFTITLREPGSAPPRPLGRRTPGDWRKPLREWRSRGSGPGGRAGARFSGWLGEGARLSPPRTPVSRLCAGRAGLRTLSFPRGRLPCSA